MLMHALQSLLGDFFKLMKSNIIIGKSGANVDAQLFNGVGARIWCFNETFENAQFKSDVVQTISGCNKMSIQVGGKEVELEPRQSCILMTNHLPRLESVNEAIKERLICVEFPVTFRDFSDGEVETLFDRRRDISLKPWFELAKNKTAFLKWLVDGAVGYYKKRELKVGIKSCAPTRVTEFTESYLYDQNLVKQFVDARCEKAPQFRESASRLKHAYGVGRT